VEAAAARWREAGTGDAARAQALDALMLRLDALATRLDAATEVQARLFSDALARGQAAAEAADARAEARLATLAGQVAAGIERQAERVAELETHFAAARDAGGAALAETLAEHARHLGAGLDTTGGMVREAAELVRAGGAELSAVAEMFADAVDRYRDASEGWRKTLVGLEDALARGGTGAGEAGQIMGTYLDQTREIFGDALRFQRELFSELRALRGATT
jgi:ABC-type transporter Mla subunit MlaD